MIFFKEELLRSFVKELINAFSIRFENLSK